MILSGDAEHRPAYIKGLRDLADWLEANPDVPFPYGEQPLQLSTSGSDEERRQDIDDMAVAMGAEPKDYYGNAQFYEVSRNFGPLRYYAVAVMQEYRDERDEIERLGREALAAKAVVS